MKYYGYYRVSTRTQVEEGYGLETQRTSIEEYAREKSIEVSEYFCDEGVSGTDESRAGLTELLAVIDKDDRVIVLNTSRLWRDEYCKIFVHHTLRKHDADVISIEQPDYSIYTKDASSFLVNGIFELLDQYSRLEINMKLAKGRRTKARTGSKPCGTMPIGYKWVNASVEVDETTAPIVQNIFKLYLEVQSTQKVVDLLDDNNYVTNTGKSFSKAAVANILHNDFYIGKMCWAGENCDGNHKAIIDRETFDAVQVILEKKNRHKKSAVRS